MGSGPVVSPGGGTRVQTVSKTSEEGQGPGAGATAVPGEVDTAAISDFVRRAKDIEVELRKVIVGQHDAVRQVLLALFAGGHVLLEGVPGPGKTLLFPTLGDVLSLRFNRIQFTPDLIAARLVGTPIASEDPYGRPART